MNIKSLIIFIFLSVNFGFSLNMYLPVPLGDFKGNGIVNNITNGMYNGVSPEMYYTSQFGPRRYFDYNADVHRGLDINVEDVSVDKYCLLPSPRPPRPQRWPSILRVLCASVVP